MMMNREQATVLNNRRTSYIEITIVSDNEEMCYSCTNGILDIFLAELRDNLGMFEIISTYIED